MRLRRVRVQSVLAAIAALPVVALSASPATAAATLQVPGSFTTIQQALDAAQTGDTVLVAPGTYFENVNFNGKSVHLVSSGGPGTTIIDGANVGPVVQTGSGLTRDAELRGFTIQHGRGVCGPLDGGGVVVSGGSALKITGNAIHDNVACSGGGGIGVNFGSPLIQSNVIERNGQIPGYSGGVGGGGVLLEGLGGAELRSNQIVRNTWTSAWGGGISLFGADPFISSNLIAFNVAGVEGGGIWIVNGGNALISDNQIASNSAATGGGVYWSVPFGSRGPMLSRNAIAGNTATNAGSQLFGDGYQHQVQVSYNNVLNTTNVAAVACSTAYGELPVFTANAVSSPNAPKYQNCGPGLG